MQNKPGVSEFQKKSKMSRVSRSATPDSPRRLTPPIPQSAKVKSTVSVPSDDVAGPSGTPKMLKRLRRVSSSSSSDSSETTDSEMSQGDKNKIKKLKKKLKRLERRSTISIPGQFRFGEEQLIPVYDPQKTEQSIDRWVRRVDELMRCYGWDNRTVMRLVATRLSGMARKWFDRLEETALNWKQLKKLIVKQFTTPLPFSKLLREAAVYEAYGGQDLGEYCFTKLDKLRALKLKIPEEYLVDAVIGGIPDEGIARSARASRFQDTTQLYGYLSTLGKMSSRRSDNRSSGNVARQWPGQSLNVQERGRNKGDSVLQCFNCKGQHLVRDCPKPKIECFSCKRLGHKRYECPMRYRAKRNGKDDKVNEISAAKVPPKNPYEKRVILNGTSFPCLVDTGSSRTLIRKSVATKLHLDVKTINAEFTLRSFDGHRVEPLGVARVHVRLEQPSVELDVIVLRDGEMNYDCILGRDFISAPNVMLVAVGDQLLLRELGEVKDICELECFEVQEGGQINFGEISEVEKASCRKLLEEFGDRISTCMSNLGKTKSASMTIKLISDEPIVYNPYRLPLLEREILGKIIQELLDNGIIRESTSSYASPVILVKKKTNDFRMCVDYRRLNAVTIKEKYPLPLIDEQLDRLGRDESGNQYKFFITLDLASGFYQVPMNEDSIDKTAFITPDSHYEFLRMPFGLCNAPAVFQRLINKVLGPLRNKIAFPYIDDVIIPATTVNEGLKRLRKVLEAFRAHDLTLKLSKCYFFLTVVDYLGREISADGIRPGKRKTEAISRMCEPKTVRQVRQFLGLSGYFRKFVKDYAKIVEPLTRLTKKNVKWQWNTEQQRAFDKIKAVLITRPVLAIFNHTLVTELHTDASTTAVAAILFQTDSEGVQHVVAYFSKQTTIEQRHYHSYELETMAVVYALQYFRVYLLGLRFTVVTDCSALRTTFSKRDLVPRVGRWWLQVQDFNFDIKYRPGARIPHVDAISRLPIVEGVNQIDITEADWILAAQLQDDKISRIRHILLNAEQTTETKQYFKEYVLQDEKVFRRMPGGQKLWVVPKLARWQVVRLCHDKAGHQSMENTVRRIQMNYWFPKMRRFVKKYVDACLNCNYYKSVERRRRGKLHPIEKHPIPFYTIHVDHVGPFETSRSGNKFLLVIVDAFTKFVIIEAVRSTKAKPVIRALQNVMCLFGVPTRIISDRGSAFTSKSFQVFCESYAIKHVLNAVATPRANGQCERYNKTIVSMLSTMSVEKDSDEWDTYVKSVQSALNTAFNRSINTTPVKALLGYQATSMAESTLINSIRSTMERLDLKELRGQIKEHIDADQQKQKEYYDKKRRDAIVFHEGDLVRVVITSESNTGSSKKLLPRYKGPFRVVKVLQNDRYEVEDLREGRRRRKVRVVMAADKMEPWITVMQK